MALLGQGWDDPQSAAIMAMSAGLLGRNFAGGLLGANQAYQQGKAAQQQAAMQQMQMKQMQMGLDREQRALETDNAMRQAAKDSFLTPERATAMSMGPMPDGSNMPMVKPGFDMAGYVNRVMQIDPAKGIGLQQALAKESPFKKLDPKDYTPESVRAFMQSGGKDHSLLQPRSKMEVSSGVVYDPYRVQPGTVLPNPNQPFMLGANGQVIPNTAYQQYEITKAGAGAAKNSVNVNTDKSYFGNVAEGLAKNDVAAIEAGRSAPDRISTARRVKTLLAANPITGTGAESRLAVTKALATAGLISGENVADTELLASTLASQTLDATKTSGLGGGAGFTNTDRDFLERAKAGRLDMNSATIGRLADLNEKAAVASINRANGVIRKLRSTPQSGQTGAFLDEINLPSAAPASQKSVVRTGTLNGRKVVQYSDGSTAYAD